MFSTTKTISRLAALTMAAGVVGLGAGPVSADAPSEGSFTVNFSDVNPCTDELIGITIHTEFQEHLDHKNNDQGRASRTGTTVTAMSCITGRRTSPKTRMSSVRPSKTLGGTLMGLHSGRTASSWRRKVS